MDKGLLEVRMVEIDLDSIDDVEQSAESVQFDVKLNGMPSLHWQEEFVYLYHVEPYVVKPPVEIDGATMRIQYLPRYDEELQGFLNFVADICRRASNEAKRTVEIQTTEEKVHLKRDFRDFLSKMKIDANQG